MACTPYNPAVGLFYHTYGWGTTSPNPWHFGLKPGTTETYQLKKSGTPVDELWISGAGEVRWLFFPTNNFLAVRDVKTSGGTDDYRVWIFDLRGSTVTHYQAATGPYWGKNPSDLHIHPNPDGLAFFMFISESQDRSKDHFVFRTDTGEQICGNLASISSLQDRRAEITITRTVKITYGTTTLKTCNLPSGNCDVQPDSPKFTDAVVGGSPALATTTSQVTIKNIGNDCLIINSIGDVAPFSVTATSQPLPVSLVANGSITVTITFAPPDVRSYGPVDLPVTRDPAQGDDKIRCSATARPPTLKLSLTPQALHFGKQPVGSSKSLPLTLRNDGEVQLAVNVPAPPAGIPFTWAPYTGTLAAGGPKNINVTFTPISENGAAAKLTVNSTTEGKTYNVNLDGSGCIANAEIVVPPAPFPAFGQVQQGFRLIRYITIINSGDGQLTFNARIDGADQALYGLMLDPPADSVINVEKNRHYVVDPVSPCGPGTAGTGKSTVAVVFFANDAPRLTSAQLILDGHNATNAVPASFTFPLTAEIMPPVAVDAALVLDRSGSMAQVVGVRKKTDAEVTAGKLFAVLIRPDGDDRFTGVKFDEIIDVFQPIVTVTAANHPGILGKINANELAPRGTTCIAGGVMVALEQLAVPRAVPPATLTKAMVLLTDGMDNTAYQNPQDGQWYSILGGNSYHPAGGMVATQPMPPPPASVKIYGIGLGKEEDIDKAALNKLSTATGGYYGVVGDLVGPTYFSLEQYFAKIYMDVADLATIRDPVYTIAPGQEQKIEFDILQGDVEAMIIVFDHKGNRLPFRLKSPLGEILDGVTMPPGFQTRVGSTSNARFVEFLMPAGEPKRYAGRWTVIVENRGEVCKGEVKSKKDMRPGFLPYDCRQTKSPIDFGIMIGVGSNFRLQPYLTPGPVHMGAPILLTAIVTEAGLPVVGCDVTVEAVAPSGATWNLTLLDDGAHEDGEQDDGEYARRFTHTYEAGSYEFTFRAVGMSRDGEPVIREAVRAKYVEGRIAVEPNGGRPGEPDLCCEYLVKLLLKALGSHKMPESQPPTRKTGAVPPAAKRSKTGKGK